MTRRRAAATRPVRTFHLVARVTRLAKVRVTAATRDEALEKFTAGDWLEEEPIRLDAWEAAGGVVTDP